MKRARLSVSVLAALIFTLTSAPIARAQDRIHHCGLLADEQMARAIAMEHQTALLLGRLGRDEPHVCSGDRFADGLGVSGIALLPLDVGLHVEARDAGR